jgi:hypothetical protein
MTSATTVTTWSDPDHLIALAEALLDDDNPLALAEQTATADSLRIAHQLIASDLAVIDHAHRLPHEVNYAELFGSWFHEKIGALIYLIKYKLLDVADAMEETQDIVDARHDMSSYVEILFHVRAVEGLGVLFDFAVAKGERERIEYWEKVCLHILHLMALLTDARPRVLTFLAAREHARRLVEQGMTVPDQGMAQAFHALGAAYVHAHKLGEIPDAPAQQPPYLRIYHRYDQGLPYEGHAGLCAYLSAKRRIHFLVKDVEVPALTHWLVHGSEAAAREVLLAKKALSRQSYIDLLAAALDDPALHPVRATAAMMEISEVSYEDTATGGEAEINHILYRIAACREDERTGLGCVAVRMLRTVDNEQALLDLIESAPQDAVATEAVVAMKDLRRLLMVEPLIVKRPQISEVYHACHRELVEIQNLLDSAWGADSPAEAEPYVQRLQELKAYPELEKINHLIQRTQHFYA